MVNSMTGFGYAEKMYGEERISVEMKSVNHRFFDVQFHMPDIQPRQEEEARKIIAAQVRRGKVSVNVSTTGNTGVERTLRTDWKLLQRYLKEAERFRELGLFSEKLQMESFLLNPDIVSVQEAPVADADAREALTEAVQAATKNLSEMRTQEGQLLKKDVEQHIDEIERLLISIRRHLPTMRVEYEERLKRRIEELVSKIDEDRLLTEVALFAEKSDINEEVVRLRAHCQQFRNTLQQTGTIGRKLDFIIQEMNREANTIGSKANDQEVSENVVEMKSALEKAKEQVQNIE